MSSDENKHAIEHAFILVGSLSGEGYLFKTEYGSFISEKAVRERIAEQFEKATRWFDTFDGSQRIRITVEVEEVTE